MPLLVQHTLVLLIVGAAAFVLLRQALSTFRGRGNKLGSCCTNGCDAQLKSQEPGERIAFLPVESLTSRARAR